MNWRISKEDLKKIIEDHEKWLESDGEEGKKAEVIKTKLQKAILIEANLQETCLGETSLQEANLRRASLQKGQKQT